MFKVVLLFFSLVQCLFAFTINDDKYPIEILSHSEIYIDKNKSETINTIKKKDFIPIEEECLSFGYSPNLDVWIRFNLTNNSNKQIHKD